MNNDRLKIFILPAVFTLLAVSCDRRKETTTLADVCRNENQTEVSIRGFLKTAPVTSDLTSQNFFLVENENGTGGFIQIEMPDGENLLNNSPVEITGEVLRTENSCVLKLTKIETQ